jgi:hypothetical protein
MLVLSYYRLSHAEDIPKLIRAVQRTCDLSDGEMAHLLGVSPCKLLKVQQAEEKLIAETWFAFCRVFNLSACCLGTGYSRRAHLAAIADAIERGDYWLPLSPKLYLRALSAKARHEAAAKSLRAALLGAAYSYEIDGSSQGLKTMRAPGFFRRLAVRLG